METTNHNQGTNMTPENFKHRRQKLGLEPFGQADMTLQRNYEGTGLGLPLVKAMTELHGGTLELFSREGQGTTATVRMPISTVMEERRKTA